ncbi:MAG: hypothetical protein J3R72DRAFT_481118 [Linnemannia gamsii]|nr:MAG: hypothetical protein J3R72DRAFT_481118 [Linnemannia gamsii]
MGSLSQLPIECMERIIHYIISALKNRQCHFLASLCQVNKRFCHITTRFLYQNTSLQMKDRQSRQLLQTLISNIPTHTLHPAVILGLGIVINCNDAYNSDSNNNNISLPSPSGLNHLYLTRCLDFKPIKYTGYDAQGINRDYTTTEMDYINSQEFLDMYLTDRKDANCLKEPHSQDRLLCYYPNAVYREAIWSLAEPIFEQLERLTFVLSDLRRYHNNVDRLEKLEYLSVNFDLVFYCKCCPDTPEAEPWRQRKEETLRLLLQFVKDHVKIFPGRLKVVNTFRTDYWAQSCPGTRCRGINGIDVHSLVRGCFDWAAREKKDLEIFSQGQGQGQDRGRFAASGSSNSFITRIRHQSIFSEIPSPSQPAWSKYGLANLRYIRLQEYRIPSRDLGTIATAFSHSLIYIHIRNILVPNDAQMMHIHLGRDWPNMPLFTHLELQTRIHQNRIALDPRLFARCPSMRFINIKDETFEYSKQEIVLWLPADLPEVKTVCLRGWSSLSLNPTTLHSTKKLRNLKLTLTRPDGYCYIPPADELDEPIRAEDGGRDDEYYGVLDSFLRPKWSWDWHLPELRKLDLTSEFAYRFEFKMLHGCPNLEILRLHMRTTEGLHTRVVSESHLFVSGVGGLPERIVSPKLKKLYMNGCWVIHDPSVLSQFLGGMFPKLERLVARGWDGVTVGSFVKAIRTTAGHIRMVRTDLVGSSEEEAVELGLSRRSYVGMKTKVFLRTRLFCSGVDFESGEDMNVLKFRDSDSGKGEVQVVQG